MKILKYIIGTGIFITGIIVWTIVKIMEWIFK